MNIPTPLSIAFILLTFTTVFILYIASHKNKKVLLVAAAYLIVQGILGYTGFYQTQPILPPKFFAMVAPSFALIFFLVSSKRTAALINSFDLSTLTLIHTIRIAAELIIFSLFVNKAVPEIMTFEGRNFDILAGLTAPIIYYLAFVKKVIGRKTLLIWNIISLGLLINIIVHATLSVELPFQQFGLDQPNAAILQFPFNWLPSIVVAIVFFAHLVSIKRLRKGN